MLYKMGWTELRPIQVDAIYEIFNTDKNIIISANTASGKTEAAYLPILSQIVDRKEHGISTIYVGPLKALINDQFDRLEDLCKLAEIPVFKWHGDVGSNAKKNFLKNPAGVLLITPESVESLFINHSHNLSTLFRSLSFIVIDEMHSFIGTERGAHLRSLISRVIHKSARNVRIVGLSATIGDLELAKQWLISRCPESISLITDPTEQKSIKYSIQGYFPKNASDNEDMKEQSLESPLIDDIIYYFYEKNKKNSLIPQSALKTKSLPL
jgi:ATP-dependent Lhr-like helicase